MKAVDLMLFRNTQNSRGCRLEIGQMGFCFVYSEFFPSSLVCFFAFTHEVLVR
ncbi:hypothetical protein RND71_009730 [Anisodus tanguticus]|uniref:Uncharacterized protein n=1 Tax=Anisodus tanguticus TaxID=243964 RepID=A0AAE1VS43_9SOLA|nr:hypothetical protein RND71_009730 [Anisodus tanguticus]